MITAFRPLIQRLLSSTRMHNLVREISESGHFDLILFDTPPILGLADTALVAEHCDGLILLVSLDFVDRGLPKEAASRIVSSGAPLLGVVTNAIKHEISFSTNRYKYGYGNTHYNDDGHSDADSESSEPPNKSDPKSWLSRITTPVRRFLRWIDFKR